MMARSPSGLCWLSASTVVALAAIPGVSAARASGVTLAPSASSDPLQCKTFTVRVKQFATDVTAQSIWAQLCSRGQVTPDTPVQVLIHGGAYNHTYWDTPFKPETYRY